MPTHRQQCHAVAGLLCEATEQVLWREVQDWISSQPARHSLQCRVGAGEATYYRPLANHRHLINYGSKMVASKLNPVMAAQWRTGREIAERGYFCGELTLPTLLAHTCCHEFAHLVQSINGWIRRGSIHNRNFYRIVDRMHAAGSGQRVLEHLEVRAADTGLPLVVSHDVPQPTIANSFKRGELVSFEYRGRAVVGEVMRVNRKTVNVKPVLPRLAADYFRISPHFLKQYSK
jgi:hypothetical protein